MAHAVPMLFLVICQFHGTTMAHASSQISEGDPASSTIPDLRITHFSPEDYDVSAQIWSVEESLSGWVFVAEQEGIRVVRGKDWRLLDTPNSTTARSLAISEENTESGFRVYYGAQSDFGYIHIKPDGSFAIHSLVNEKQLSDVLSSMGDVWGTHVVGPYVYFQSRQYIFRYDGLELKQWFSENGFHNSFSLNGKLYAREYGVGLKVLGQNGPSLVNGSEILADERIFGMTEHKSGRTLVWSDQLGLLTIDANENLSWEMDYPPELLEISKESRLYHIDRNELGQYVISTLGSGVVFIDENMSVTRTIGVETGLPNDVVNYVSYAKDGSVWIGFDSEGIARLSSDVALLRFGRDQGLKGNIYRIGLLGGKVGLATSEGLFIIDEWSERFNSNSKAFVNDASVKLARSVSDFEFVFDFLESDGMIFAASESDGLKYLHDHEFDVASSTSLPWKDCVFQNSGSDAEQNKMFSLGYSQYSGQVLVGMDNGIAEVEVEAGGACTIRKLNVDYTNYDVRSIVTTEEGILFATRYSGVFYYQYQNKSKKLEFGITKAADFEQIDKIPEGTVSLTKWKNDALIVSQKGIYRHTAEALEELTDIKSAFDDSYSRIFSAFTTESGIVTIVDSEKVSEFKSFRTNFFEPDKVPLALQFSKDAVASLFVGENEIIWFNDGSELVRYDPFYESLSSGKFTSHVSKATINSTGTILFSGTFSDSLGVLLDSQVPEFTPLLNYEDRNLSFDLSATDFANPEDTRFRYLIEGKNTEWSSWSIESSVSVLALREGNYTLVVQAKNEWGQISDDARYSFTILPPWYRTFWAYFAYVVLIISLFLSARKYISMRRANKAAQEQAKELEREREVVKKLQEANDRLIQANKLKDEFLATTSHELRTPLTAILGFTDVLKDEIPKDAEYREFLDIIGDSGSRLMETLNSLLDLAKLRAGIMEINLEPVDLYQLSMQVHLKFQESAVNKGLRLKVEKPESRTAVMADVHAIERILHNLIGNAVKFTSDGGVTITLQSVQDRVLLKVRDTGIGIESEFLPELFDAFIQESDGLSRSYEGTGLGLAITSGLVSLLDASISVESEKGVGSTFIVNLPVAEQIGHGRHRLMGMRPGVRS